MVKFILAFGAALVSVLIAEILRSFISHIYSCFHHGGKSLNSYRRKRLIRDWKLLFYFASLVIVSMFLSVLIVDPDNRIRYWLLKQDSFTITYIMIAALVDLSIFFFLFVKRLVSYFKDKNLAEALVEEVLSSPQNDEQIRQFWEIFNEALKNGEQAVATLLLETLVRKTTERTLRGDLMAEEAIGKLTRGLNLLTSFETGERNRRMMDFIGVALTQVARESYWKTDPALLFSLMLVYFSLWKGLLRVEGPGTLEAKYYLNKKFCACLIECTKELSGWEDFLKEGEKPCSTLKAKWKEMVDFLSSKDTGLREVIINELQALISSDSPPCLKELVEHLRKIHHG